MASNSLEFRVWLEKQALEENREDSFRAEPLKVGPELPCVTTLKNEFGVIEDRLVQRALDVSFDPFVQVVRDQPRKRIPHDVDDPHVRVVVMNPFTGSRELVTLAVMRARFPFQSVQWRRLKQGLVRVDSTCEIRLVSEKVGLFQVRGEDPRLRPKL